MAFKIRVQNFRAIEDAEIALRRVTILTGPNGAGKSSFLYALQLAKNVVKGPTQPLDSFFHVGSINLGSFRENVSWKDISRRIQITARVHGNLADSSYTLALGDKSSTMTIEAMFPFAVKVTLKGSFPYTLTTNVNTAPFSYKGLNGEVVFNGFSSSLSLKSFSGTKEDEANTVSEVQRVLNNPLIVINAVDSVDLKRGFSRPTYAPVPLSAEINTEDEMATFLANDREVEAKVSFALERLTNKRFAVRPALLGSGSFYLQTIDLRSELVCDLVNEGFGFNQLIFLLAKISQPSARLICIEEPESHLHPELLAKLADALLVFSKRTNSRLLISSHSEQFVVSFLNRVARKEVDADDVGVYYVTKNDSGASIFEDQRLNDKGQLEGGLKSFYEPAITEMRDFLTIGAPVEPSLG